MLLASLTLLSLLLGAADAHSWVACADVRGIQNPRQAPRGPTETDPNRLAFNRANCKGYTRDWQRYDADFGVDRGANFQASPGRLCQRPRGPYDPRFPMPTYVSGSDVCVQYPSKNHVASKTTNPFIPDNVFKIYRSGVNPSADAGDVSSMVEVPHYNGVHSFGVIDYKGFQNCPGFDKNNERSVCTACFNIGNLSPGTYSFVWYWVFNKDTPPYTDCWEANVVARSGAAATPSPVASAVPAQKSSPSQPVCRMTELCSRYCAAR